MKATQTKGRQKMKQMFGGNDLERALKVFEQQMRSRKAKAYKRKRNCLERAWLYLTRGGKPKDWELLKP